MTAQKNLSLWMTVRFNTTACRFGFFSPYRKSLSRLELDLGDVKQPSFDFL